MKKNKLILALLVLFIMAIVASGCVFGPSEDADSVPIDPPQTDYTENDGEDIVLDISDSNDEVVGSEEEARVEVDRVVYLMDHQGYVVPTVIKVPQTESVAKQALQYLVADGPVTSQLPSGIREVLPAGTELDVSIKDGIATVDFNNEFKNYKAEDEKSILEAITWTLTEFDSIDEVVIWINGYPQEVMPVDGTPIVQTLSRKDGINIEMGQSSQIGNSMAVTLYFKAQNSAATHEYFVPVSRMIPRSEDMLASTVEQLISGPLVGSGLFSDMFASTQLLEAELNDNVAVLNFDEQFLRFSEEESKASDDALWSLVLSLTENDFAEKVQFMVNGESNILSLEGIDLSQPVSRHELIAPTGF